jgi:Zn finger protein HypA/HybF involved in hydrogenase expression
MMATVSLEEYETAVDLYQGWCTDCKQFTRDQTEPDAEGYDCPVCEEDKVIGAEQGMMLEAFNIDFGEG